MRLQPHNPLTFSAARMWMLDFKSHDPLYITYSHIYYCSIGQMTGFRLRRGALRLYAGGWTCRTSHMVDLQAISRKQWQIERRYFFLKLWIKSAQRKIPPLPQNAQSDLSNDFGDRNYCPVRRCCRNGMYLWLLCLTVSKPTPSPGW